MPNIHELYRDALFRRATEVEGYENHLVVLLVAILNEVEADLVGQIASRYEALGPSRSRAATPARMRRLQSMIDKIKEIRRLAWADVTRTIRMELREFAQLEVDFTIAAFEEAVGLEGITLAAPTAAALRAATFDSPFRLNPNSSAPLAQWLASLQQADLRRLEQAIRIGFLEAEDVGSLVRRIRGTRANRYRDGILQLTRRQAEAVVRTTVNHFANAARATTWENNADIMEGLVWVSTLDGRTTPICRARDGHVAPIGGKPIPPGHPPLQPPHARPPAHAQCRSLMVALISAEGLIGTRPFVVDTRTGRRREIDFQRMAREQGRPVAEVRREWAEQRVGRLPARTTYQEFLQAQSVEFQNEVLGPNRAALFREGGLDLTDFVTTSGRQYSLDELRRRHAEAFRKAGLS